MAGSAIKLYKDRAQAFVPLDHIAKGSFQRNLVQPTTQAQCHRNIVSRTWAFQAAHEPKPALGKGQRDLRRARHGSKWRPSCLGAIKPLSQSSYGGSLKEAADGKLNFEHSAYTADQPCDQKGVPP